MFYFKYQLTLELIPHVEGEINQFINHAHKALESDAENNAAKLMKVISKKINQIDKFYEKSYVDYRAHFILKSRRKLTDFVRENIYLLKKDAFPEQQPQEIFQRKSEEKIIRKEENTQSEMKISAQPMKIQSEKKKKQSEIKQKTEQPQKLIKEQKKKIESTKIKEEKEKSKKQIRVSPKKEKIPTKRKSPSKTEAKEKKMSKEEYISYLKRKQK